MRFIVIYSLKDFRERQENIWLLPSSMINHDFRQGPLVPNKWFPAWCKLGFAAQEEEQPFEIRRWCEANCRGDVVMFPNWGGIMGFQYHEDAMSFSLTYHENIVDQGTWQPQ